MNDNQKRLVAVLSITLLIFILELVGGFFANSLALISDAGHMLTDVMALGLALAALFFAARPANSKKTYGFYRLEILSALFNGALLVLIALYIFYEAYLRIVSPAEVKSGLMLGIAAIGLAANLIGAFILSKGSRDNLNIRGAFMHVISDAVSSCGVIIGGLIIFYTGWVVVDPLLGVMIGLLILRGAIGLITESVDILLEATPKGIRLEEVIADIRKVKGVIDIHDLHAWTITSGMNSISAHILIEDALTERAAEILGEIREIMEHKYNLRHCTFQTECQSCPEGVVCRLPDRQAGMQPEEREGHRH